MGQWLTGRRLAGIGALGYFIGVSIEKQEVLTAPTLESPVAEIRSNYLDHAFGTVTATAGTLALISFVLMTAALIASPERVRRVDDAEDHLEPSGVTSVRSMMEAGKSKGRSQCSAMPAEGAGNYVRSVGLERRAGSLDRPGELAVVLIGIGVGR
jgi:hypothetical protein